MCLHVTPCPHVRSSVETEAVVQGMDIEKYVRETLGNVDKDTELTPQQKLQRRYGNAIESVKLRSEILRYRYYNWRKDTTSDLFLILCFNATLIGAGALAKYFFVDPYLRGSDVDPDTIAAQSAGIANSAVGWWDRLWPDIYQVRADWFQQRQSVEVLAQPEWRGSDCPRRRLELGSADAKSMRIFTPMPTSQIVCVHRMCQLRPSRQGGAAYSSSASSRTPSDSHGAAGGPAHIWRELPRRERVVALPDLFDPDGPARRCRLCAPPRAHGADHSRGAGVQRAAGHQGV